MKSQELKFRVKVRVEEAEQSQLKTWNALISYKGGENREGVKGSQERSKVRHTWHVILWAAWPEITPEREVVGRFSEVWSLFPRSLATGSQERLKQGI